MMHIVARFFFTTTYIFAKSKIQSVPIIVVGPQWLTLDHTGGYKTGSELGPLKLVQNIN